MAVNFINQYPYTDFHELNLDWIIGELGKKAPGRWATITIHSDEWNNGTCTVTGITGMTANTPFLWTLSPATIYAGGMGWGVVPIAQADDEITFGWADNLPDSDTVIYLLIGE